MLKFDNSSIASCFQLPGNVLNLSRHHLHIITRGVQCKMLSKCLKHYMFFNTLRPRQNGRHFPDDIFKCIFLNENVWISIKMSPKFLPEGPIDNIPALVQIMAWRRPSQIWLVYWGTYTSFALNDLSHCGTVTQHGDIYLVQHWRRQWLVACRYQNITVTMMTYHL